MAKLRTFSPAQSCFDHRERMDSGEMHYHKLNRVLLTVLGLWPGNNLVLQRMQKTFFILLFAFSIGLQLAKIILSVSNLESLLQILSFAVPCLMFSLKYATFCIKSRDVRKLMEQMECNWFITKRKEEIKILNHYAAFGYMMIVGAIVVLYTFVFMFLLTQMMPKILDIVMPLNESRPCKLLGLAALFFDENEHFVAIFVHMTVALLAETTTIVVTEATCLMYIYHSSALFQITSFRMEHVFDCELRIPVRDKDTMLRTNIIEAVISHNRAIEYFEYVNATFGISYLILVVLGVCSLSINMFCLFQASFTRELKQVFASTLLVICHFIYMFTHNLIAQSLTNVSLDVFYATCNLPWYMLPVRLQKMIRLIIRRSMTGSAFKMSSFFEGSLEFFSSIVSVSLSYFTVFWSLHR